MRRLVQYSSQSDISEDNSGRALPKKRYQCPAHIPLQPLRLGTCSQNILAESITVMGKRRMNTVSHTAACAPMISLSNERREKVSKQRYFIPAACPWLQCWFMVHTVMRLQTILFRFLPYSLNLINFCTL